MHTIAHHTPQSKKGELKKGKIKANQFLSERLKRQLKAEVEQVNVERKSEMRQVRSFTFIEDPKPNRGGDVIFLCDKVKILLKCSGELSVESKGELKLREVATPFVMELRSLLWTLPFFLGLNWVNFYMDQGP